jgi:hypothetical protein
MVGGMEGIKHFGKRFNCGAGTIATMRSVVVWRLSSAVLAVQ